MEESSRSTSYKAGMSNLEASREGDGTRVTRSASRATDRSYSSVSISRTTGDDKPYRAEHGIHMVSSSA